MAHSGLLRLMGFSIYTAHALAATYGHNKKRRSRATYAWQKQPQKRWPKCRCHCPGLTPLTLVSHILPRPRKKVWGLSRRCEAWVKFVSRLLRGQDMPFVRRFVWRHQKGRSCQASAQLASSYLYRDTLRGVGWGWTFSGCQKCLVN